MLFHATKLPGVFVVQMQLHADDRGYFARTYCEKEFADQGLCTHWVQTSTSFNQKRGTLRGMHMQASPHGEIKLIRCTRGSIFDVAVDLRPDSATFRQWVGVELTAENHKMLYIPQGLAHGFQTLEDHSEVLYYISTFYVPEAARGVRWNDAAFAIQWPIATGIILSPRDQAYDDFPS